MSTVAGMRGLGPILLSLTVGCATTVHTKKLLIAEALDAPDDRKSNFEATLRVLDEHPDYVDEMVKQALDHLTTMERFIANTTRELVQEWLAEITAKHLVAHPGSLERILIETQDAADTPESQRAISRAIELRSSIGARAIATRPSAVKTMTAAMIQAVTDLPEQRRMFLEALREQRNEVAAMLVADPETLGALVDTLSELAAKDPRTARVIIGRTMSHMNENVLAEVTARALVRRPSALARILGEAIELGIDQSVLARQIEAGLRRLRGVGGGGPSE